MDSKTQQQRGLDPQCDSYKRIAEKSKPLSMMDIVPAKVNPCPAEVEEDEC